MYPVLRLAWQVMRYRNAPPLDLLATHVSWHRCLPWDIDLWRELNNGRTLTLFDLGRVPLAHRTGLLRVLRRQSWGFAVAGASVRYRRRIRMFERIEMRSRVLCWDDRFVYLEQSMWNRSGNCANHILLRAAITGCSGIVPPDDVMLAFGHAPQRPVMPDWVAAWIYADRTRPWPPAKEALATSVSDAV
ncbi:MAG: acyl-CoA thioesterase [Pseudomonadota bacterium]